MHLLAKRAVHPNVVGNYSVRTLDQQLFDFSIVGFLFVWNSNSFVEIVFPAPFGGHMHGTVIHKVDILPSTLPKQMG
jgi:hypothetical protein